MVCARTRGIKLCVRVAALLTVKLTGSSNRGTDASASFAKGEATTARLRATSARPAGSRRDVQTGDPLTGQLDGPGLRKAVRSVATEARGSLIAVHCLNLDGFKAINERYSHAAGNLLLQAIADRLRDAVPAGSVIARTRGDGFVIVQGSIT